MTLLLPTPHQPWEPRLPIPLVKVLGPGLRLNLTPGKQLNLGQSLLARGEYLSPDIQVQALRPQAQNQAATRTGLIPLQVTPFFPPNVSDLL